MIFCKISKHEIYIQVSVNKYHAIYEIGNTDGEILITCKGLKDAKKCDTNGEEDTILGIIHTENIEN